ncbi:hypothetical protein BFU36_04490 [Sulfolobus sp. A20]|uniref:hypothetical protein n=1 Tax=Saccharolobus sp. A20 TaxID=1891280 RepID=UPI00084606E7|nr:hypothetical protein [Sulfolobus sp. A20]TRM74633.1 hypothetical protein DJ532_12390 [Sulfolobus sp. A20-N-F8]TRM78681.1 hypothetical protein DJ528_04275 [Sulfolobus sp. B5]TRM79724.1 hypothetical protein DJ531_13325 [Sulfolobus sp. A20-N-F6]TRM80271.1 hypothetical protein DJ524_08165 [Sulfolobus sp. D5]TRM84880.1 hypothetical protein DJ522_02995 [Sulfolobus sp. F3]TRM86820.1 hypothetical protein DJ529_10290 [Sulfolobus sp. C3]TRM93664.1 hypothetical protein DJ526_03325 [Sulfolobus sp. A2
MSGTIRKIALIAGFPCAIDLINYVNNLDADLIIGLGDVECPQYIKSEFYGILGEMEDVSVLKYLRKNNKYFTKLSNISSDFSSEVVVTHYPPKGSITGKIFGVTIGSEDIMNKVKKHQPLLLFHAHSSIRGEFELGKTKIVSIGNLINGHYVEYYVNEMRYEFKEV